MQQIVVVIAVQQVYRLAVLLRRIDLTWDKLKFDIGFIIPDTPGRLSIAAVYCSSALFRIQSYDI